MSMLEIIASVAESGATEPDKLIVLKSALWAVGHVGSCALGIALIQRNRAFENIVAIAEKCSTLSVRGYEVDVLMLTLAFYLTSPSTTVGLPSVCLVCLAHAVQVRPSWTLSTGRSSAVTREPHCWLSRQLL